MGLCSNKCFGCPWGRPWFSLWVSPWGSLWGSPWLLENRIDHSGRGSLDMERSWHKTGSGGKTRLRSRGGEGHKAYQLRFAGKSESATDHAEEQSAGHELHLPAAHRSFRLTQDSAHTPAQLRLPLPGSEHQ